METPAMLPNEGADPRAFAASVRELLADDPRRYRNFGAYWYFVKALLKRVYDKHEMPMLGDFEDQTVIDRMGDYHSARHVIALSIETYQHNATFNDCRNRVEDPSGEFFWLSDPDMGG